jgi:hypothetical protein
MAITITTSTSVNPTCFRIAISALIVACRVHARAGPSHSPTIPVTGIVALCHTKYAFTKALSNQNHSGIPVTGIPAINGHPQ